MAVYAISLLPSCIAAIWRPNIAAIWLFCIASVSTFGFGYQIFARNQARETLASNVGSMAWTLLLVSIPILLGYTFLKEKKVRL